jgi:hypothetical protein
VYMYQSIYIMSLLQGKYGSGTRKVGKRLPCT